MSDIDNPQIPINLSQKSATTNKRQHPARLNALKHGLRGTALPPGCARIGRRLTLFRAQLEAAVLAERFEITIVDSARIDTATRWQRHADLAARWLTKAWEELDHEQRLRFSAESARAASERDKAIASLGLSVGETTDIDRLVREIISMPEAFVPDGAVPPFPEPNEDD